MNHLLTSLAQLEAVYGRPQMRSVWKEIDHLSDDYRAFVEASPLVVLASIGAGGVDCSPKGDAPGFVRVLNARTVAVPDRPGNNRIDNLRNIVEDGRVSLLFIVPGIGEMLRINGRAVVSTEPHLLSSFNVHGKLPRTVVVVTIDSVYFHCAKAVARAKLWDASRHVERSLLPSTGDMLSRLTQGPFNVQAYETQLAERLKTELY